MKRSLRELMADERAEAIYTGACPRRQHGRRDEDCDPAGAQKHRQKSEHLRMIAL
jgi:hypothetical protein